MRKRLFVVLLLGLIFYVRFAFLITVMAEERTFGGFYEPLRVIAAKIDMNGKLHPVLIPSRNEEFLKKKRFGPIVFLIRTNLVEPHSIVKMKIGEKEFPFLYLPYIGPLTGIYIPKLYMKIFGRSIYSLRSFLLAIFLFFMFLYMGFAQRCDRENYFLISLYLITFPIFGMVFATPFFWNGPMIFTTTIILVQKMKRVVENSLIDSLSMVIILIASGFIIHSHLLAGGVIIFSIFLAFFSTGRNTSLKIKTSLLIFGALLFLLLILPYILSPITGIKGVIFRGKDSVREILLLPINSILYYLAGIFAGPSFVEIFIHDKIDISYLPVSIPSGIIMIFGFIGLFISRKNGKFEKFIFLTCLFYLVITLFGDIRSYHINYILPFIVLFIPDGLRKLGVLSEKGIKSVLVLGIFLNIVQLEMLRESVKNSSLSLSLHKEVADYLIKNKIKKIHNIAGMYDYVFISKEKIEVIDFIPFIGYNHPRERIYLSLLLSRGEVILLESYKRGGITTGVSLEEALDIARETGLKIKVLKKIPDEGKYQLGLARVE